MSSLIVASDLDLMMLEISIEKLVVPRSTDFDAALLKKSVVMFRLLDKDWTSVHPQRMDYHVYRGSNFEIEPFNGGVSVVFAIPQSSLDSKMDNVDLQIHVHRELSKYFELQSSESVGIVCIDVSDLFNGVINGMKKRDLDSARVPVAKSSKDTYALVSEDGTESGAKATVYLRLTHLGHSLISEIEVPDDPKRLFYAREETSEKLPYQCREITLDELTSGCWGSETLVPPRNPRDTICCCDAKDTAKLLGHSNEASNQPAESLGKGGEEEGGEEEGGEEKEGEEKGGDEKTPDVVDGEDNGDKKDGKKPGKGDDDDDDNDDRNGDENGDEDGVENGDGNGGVTEGEEPEADEGGTVSCLLKPSLCGQEGTCNKKDKKGKFGKCGRPDGEGGNPLACGERRKCARRKMAAGSATVGIVDKKIPCPPPRPPPVCRCPPVSTYPPAWSACTTSSRCASCQPIYYGSTYGSGSTNLCHGYETPRYTYENTCRPTHAGW